MNSPFFIQAQRVAPTYGIGDVVRRLGQEQHGSRPRSIHWQIGYIADLVAKCGFPAPLPLRVRDRATGEHHLSTAVQRGSRWQRAAVDQWFEDLLPPGAAGDVGDQRAGDAIMDERAKAIGLHMIEGGRP